MIILLAVASASLLVYANTLQNELVYDDLVIIGDSPAVRNPWGFSQIWGNAGWLPDRPGAIYRPLSLWTLALNYRLNEDIGIKGENPVTYHIVNILLHAIASCTFCYFLFRLPLPAWPVLVAALIFAVHPIHTEAVDGIVGRAEILALIFGVVLLILHRERRPVYLGAFAYLLAIWSKESAIAFFPLAIAIDFLFPRPKARWTPGAYTAYAAVAVAWLVVWKQVTGKEPIRYPFIDNPTVALSWYQRLLTAASVQLEYLRLQLFPIPLSSDYSYNQIQLVLSVWNFRVGLFLVLLAAACWLGWTLRKKHPVVPFALLAYAILFATTSNIAMPIGTIMGERLAYAPSIGVCLLLGYGTWWLWQRLQPRAALAAIVGPVALIVLFVVVTVKRNNTWASERTFYQTQGETAPRSAKAHYNFGHELAKARDNSAAIREYENAIAILPFYSEAFYAMGNALVRIDAAPDRVIRAYRSAIEYDSADAKALGNLASYFLDLGRAGEAEPLIAELAKLNPTFPTLEALHARLSLASAAVSGQVIPAEMREGILDYANGNYASAIDHLEHALQAGDVPPNMRKTMLLLLAKSFDAVGRPDRGSTYQQMADSLGR